MRETLIRSGSGLAYIVLLTAAIFYRPLSFLMLFGAFMLIAVSEFCTLIKLRKMPPLAVAASVYVLFACFPVITGLGDILLMSATLFVSVKCIGFLFDTERRRLDTTGKYVYLIGYIVLPFVLMAKLPFQEDYYQPKVIYSIFLLVWTNDTFAFIVGKTMGRTKLLESVSPKKTVEGFIGGVGFAILAALFICRYFLYQQLYVWVIIALIVGFIGTLGDLIESKFKRQAKVKDSGNLMPGHGGILDRLDSVIFAAPFVFLFYQILYHVS
jgi:phosphatidate cytidylyltransferase